MSTTRRLIETTYTAVSADDGRLLYYAVEDPGGALAYARSHAKRTGRVVRLSHVKVWEIAPESSPREPPLLSVRRAELAAIRSRRQEWVRWPLDRGSPPAVDGSLRIYVEEIDDLGRFVDPGILVRVHEVRADRLGPLLRVEEIDDRCDCEEDEPEPCSEAPAPAVEGDDRSDDSGQPEAIAAEGPKNKPLIDVRQNCTEER